VSFTLAKKPLPPSLQALRELPNARDVSRLLRAVYSEVGAEDPGFSCLCDSLANYIDHGTPYGLGAAVD
jgi:hypothetical protein